MTPEQIEAFTIAAAKTQTTYQTMLAPLQDGDFRYARDVVGHLRIMTPKEIEPFRVAAAQSQLNYQALEYAGANLAAMEHFSEQETLEFMGRFDHVFAFWVVSPSEGLQCKKIVGPEAMSGTETMNAISVASEAEADHWRDLFEEKSAPRRAPKPRLVVSN